MSSDGGGGFALASTAGSSRRATLTSLADFERVDEPSDASGLAETGRNPKRCVVAIVDDCDGGCGAGEGVGDCTCGMEVFGSSLFFSSRGAGPCCGVLFIILADVLLRRPWMDLSRINSMAAARCEFPPDEESRMILEIKAPSTEGFSFDWKSSCSISLIRL